MEYSPEHFFSAEEQIKSGLQRAFRTRISRLIACRTTVLSHDPFRGFDKNRKKDAVLDWTREQESSKSVIDCCDWKDRCGHEDSDDLSRLMDRCWTRSPTKRPDFRELKAVIRRLNNLPCSASEALLEALVGRLEQYASSLESLVEERTADYLEQKRKAEDLLYQLLPK
ncbi:hypothetical protein MRX96_054887 [Rhipicephalus microplus]